MVWWTVFVDLNTDRRVEAKLQKHTLESWRGETHTAINMAFVFLQMSKHVSHILKSLHVL